jgi:hypothetical protein
MANPVPVGEASGDLGREGTADMARAKKSAGVVSTWEPFVFAENALKVYEAPLIMSKKKQVLVSPVSINQDWVECPRLVAEVDSVEPTLENADPSLSG